MLPGVIDRIYESAFAPERWPGVLSELAEMAEARGGVFFAVRKPELNWTASERLRDVFGAYVNEGWIARCTRRAKWFSLVNPRFSVEHDIWTDEELSANPVYCDFLRPRGLGWCAATTIATPTQDYLWLSIERDFERGPVERAYVEKLDELRPHLARSAFMAARLRLERARSFCDALTQIGLPAAVFDERGATVATNELIEAQTDFVRWGAGDRLSLKDRDADALLRQAIDAAERDAGASARSIALRDAEGCAAMVAHVVPIRGQARDLFTRSAGVLTITPVSAPPAPPVELLQSLFDLTTAEAAVARKLTAGATVEEIAEKGGVSINTVRKQVRGVLEKTGCRRQAEVVALLGGLRLQQRRSSGAN
jgi:DNA-binding CsgD family transcriptional regulator